MNKLPKARTSEIVVQTAGVETMIYDLTADKAYLLNDTSAFVWQICDGQNDLTTISKALAEKMNQPVSEDIVKLAIDGLRANDLLDEPETVKDFFTKTSRRKVIRQIGLATMIALPTIFSLSAPAAAHATSLTAACQPCTAPAQCASGRCPPYAYPRGDRICSNGTDTRSTNRTGFNMRAAENARECAAYGVQYCCAGNGATFNGPNDCVCNP